MKYYCLFFSFIFILLFSSFSYAADSNSITGAGSTFVYPILSKWAAMYNDLTGVKLNYQSIGSGGGIAQITAGTVGFGATDMPLKPDVLKAKGLIQFPIIIGGVVPVVNLPDIFPHVLNLTGEVLANIYLGRIISWNDPSIAVINPEVVLPNLPIVVVHRSDGSGTTFILSHYLSQVSSYWKTVVGEGTSLDFPAGIGGKGNEGVAAMTMRAKGAIGYVEYAYAIQNHMNVVSMDHVVASLKTFQAAVDNTDWVNAENFYVLLTNKPNSWPMVGATFILLHTRTNDVDSTMNMLKFFNWAYNNGGDAAKTLNYVMLPSKVVTTVEDSWHIVDDKNAPISWK
jgi:phosphate transport system substrate-binding protein